MPAPTKILAIAESAPPYRRGDWQPLPEKLLARLWQQRAARQAWFRTNGGRRVRVLYPGRAGTGAGPDFRDALLEVEGVGLVQGDVEIHRRQQDWDAHGHGTDHNYNGVVLHAALEVTSGATPLPSGQETPVVSLASLLVPEAAEADTGESLESGRLWSLLEAQGYLRPNTSGGMGELLDRAGDDRFRGKSSRFQKFLAEQSPEQTLYEGILEALGYRNNQQPFLRLATVAPYAALEQALRARPAVEQAPALQSWLLQLSGWLPPERSDSIVWPRTGFGRPMSSGEWHCFRVRPANHPRRRIVGAARLLARFWETGLVAGLGSLVQSGSPSRLTAALTVKGDADQKAAYIGASRARDLLVNVVLPFFHGRAALQGSGGDAAKCLQLYHQVGKLQDNELVREMADRLMPGEGAGLLTGARRQQGLIHLQRLLGGSR